MKRKRKKRRRRRRMKGNKEDKVRYQMIDGGCDVMIAVLGNSYITRS